MTDLARPGAVARALNMTDMRAYLDSIRQRLPVFVIYDHPTDWPEFYVARLHLSIPEPAATAVAVMDKDLDRIRTTMRALGLVKLDRFDQDDPKILETWL